MTEGNNNLDNNLCNQGNTPGNDNIILNEKYYNCSECRSLIEILSFSDNIIEFKCIKENHKVKMPINEYLAKMKKFNNIHTNSDVCKIHEKKYIVFCFNCNYHLCQDCLKSRNHINHNKNNIIEIQPVKEEINKIETMIEDYQKKIYTLEIEKINMFYKFEEKYENDKKIVEKINQIKIKKNSDEKNKELTLNKELYLNDIKKIKLEYENKLKNRKYEYIKKNNEINNKYKFMKLNMNILYDNEFIKLEKEKQVYETRKKEEVKQKLNNYINCKRLNEIILNTYNISPSNYFNSINITNLIKSHNQNIKNILPEKNELKKEQKINKDVNELIIIYKINKLDKINKLENEIIQIFGTNFVQCNKDKCKIIYNKEELELTDKLRNINNNNILEIKLKGFENVTNMSYMFHKCNNLLYIPDISKWDTSKIIDMSYLFYECSKIEYLPDISDWNVENVYNMTGMFSGCQSLISLPNIAKWKLNNYLIKKDMFLGCKDNLNIPNIFRQRSAMKKQSKKNTPKTPKNKFYN